MTQIDLVTGLLGAGKTTFLLRYAQACLDRGERIAILENDFGAVNVDVALLRGLKSDRCQIEMVSGGGDSDCHRRRFKTQLIALGMQHLDRVIVEPSGIFDMDEFFDTLYTSPLDRWFTIGSILTILDAAMEEELTPQMTYIFASEAAYSGRLILSKQKFGILTAYRRFSQVQLFLRAVFFQGTLGAEIVETVILEDHVKEDRVCFVSQSNGFIRTVRDADQICGGRSRENDRCFCLIRCQ